MDVSWQAGRIVGEHWRLRDRLGGQRCRFWDAEELRAGSRVVIERSPVALSDPQARLQFSRETRALLAFRSPHVVRTLHRALAGEGVVFTVTEFLAGENLDQYLARRTVLGFSETVQIVDQCCRGIVKLEAAGLAHRVLEPERVFLVIDPLSGAPVVKLLVTGFGSGTLDSVSAQYRSPECAASPRASGVADAAAQVWALGVLGCRMLTGALPFDADSRGTLADDWGARFTRLREARSELPPELDEWFRIAIHPEPGSRFASVEQAGLALGHIATSHASKQARLRASVTARGHSHIPKGTPPPTPRARSEPQRAAAPVRPRSALLEIDRTSHAASAALEQRPAPVISRVAKQGSSVLQIPNLDIHQRDTVESQLHAAAKRKRRVQSGERNASIGRALRVGAIAAGPPASEPKSELPFGLREPAPLAVRPPEPPLAVVAPAPREVTHAIAVVTPSIADRDRRSRELAVVIEPPSEESARTHRIERARWRGLAVLAVVLGLFGGFALRSLVHAKLQSVRTSFSRAGQADGVPAHVVVLQPAAAELPVVSASETRTLAPAAEADALEPASLTDVHSVVASSGARATMPRPVALPRRASSLELLEPEPAHVATPNDPLPRAAPQIDTNPVQIYRGF